MRPSFRTSKRRKAAMSSALPKPWRPSKALDRDLVSRLSNGPYGAYEGFLWGLVGDTK